MQPLVYEFLCLSEEFCRKDTDARSSIADLVVLYFGNIDEDFGGGVVEGDALQDGRAVISDDNIASADRVQDLVHAFWAQCGFNEVA